METAIVSEIIKIIVSNYPEFLKRELKIKELKEENYFGNCSVCGGNDGCLNIGRSHYFVCDKHKKCWNVGSNLFSDWRNENEKTWIKNSKKICKYDEIDGYEWSKEQIKKLKEKIPDKEVIEFSF